MTFCTFMVDKQKNTDYQYFFKMLKKAIIICIFFVNHKSAKHHNFSYRSLLHYCLGTLRYLRLARQVNLSSKFGRPREIHQGVALIVRATLRHMSKISCILGIKSPIKLIPNPSAGVNDPNSY